MAGLLKLFDPITNVLGGLFGGGGKDTPAPAPPPAPVIEPPPVMPLPDDKATQMAKRRSIAEQLKRKGRASTILTASGDIGAPPGTSDTLGA